MLQKIMQYNYQLSFHFVLATKYPYFSRLDQPNINSSQSGGFVSPNFAMCVYECVCNIFVSHLGKVGGDAFWSKKYFSYS